MWRKLILVGCALGLFAPQVAMQTAPNDPSSARDGILESLTIDQEERMSGHLRWNAAADEGSIGAYDVMFSPTTNPADRMAFVEHIQGRWIVPKNPSGRYEVDIRKEQIPFGAKFLLIFSGFPSDTSKPLVVPLFESRAEMQSAVQTQHSAEPTTHFTGIVLPQPKLPTLVVQQQIAPATSPSSDVSSLTAPMSPEAKNDRPAVLGKEQLATQTVTVEQLSDKPVLTSEAVKAVPAQPIQHTLDGANANMQTTQDMALAPLRKNELPRRKNNLLPRRHVIVVNPATEKIPITENHQNLIEETNLAQLTVEIGQDVDVSSGVESDWQVQQLAVRFSHRPQTHDLAGTLRFLPARKQQDGINSYEVWWGSQCDEASKIADRHPEDPTGRLMVFYRDNNGYPYERFFDWRSPPLAAHFLMVISSDQYGVGIVPPVCFGPFNVTTDSNGDLQLVDLNKPSAQEQIDYSHPTYSFPSGTEPVTHAQMLLGTISENIDEKNSDKNDISEKTNLPVEIPAQPESGSAMIPAIEEQYTTRSENAGKPVYIGANELIQEASSTNSKFFGVPYIGAVWDHLPYLSPEKYQIPWAPRSMSPSQTPVTYPSVSPSMSSPPSFSPSPLPPPPVSTLVCYETDRMPRDVQFLTTGPVKHMLSGILKFRPTQANLGATHYRVYYVSSCGLDGIVPNSDSIAEVVVNPALPHDAFEVVLQNVPVVPNARQLLIVAVNSLHLPVGEPFCVSLLGGSCPNVVDNTLPPPCQLVNTVYSVRNAKLSSPGPVNGLLDGVISFDDASINYNEPDVPNVRKYFARFSKSCFARDIIQSHGVDYYVSEWTRQPNQVSYMNVLHSTLVPTGTRYVLLFSADTAGTPLAPPVALPIIPVPTNSTTTDIGTDSSTAQTLPATLHSMHFIDVTGNSSRTPSGRSPGFDLTDLRATTTSARNSRATLAIQSLRTTVMQHLAVGNVVFELMQISPDDVNIIFDGGHQRAVLFGVAEQVSQYLIDETSLTPVVLRTKLRDPPVEKPDFAYSLLVSMVPFSPDNLETLAVGQPVTRRSTGVHPVTAVPKNPSIISTPTSTIFKVDSQVVGVLPIEKVPEGPLVATAKVLLSKDYNLLPPEKVSRGDVAQSPSNDDGVKGMMDTLLGSVRSWLSRTN